MFATPESILQQFNVDPGMSVADLGSGAGFYSILLGRAVGPSGKVYAVDVQKSLLQKIQADSAAQGVFNIKPIWGDLDNLKGTTLPDNSVDRVVIVNTLFQVENKDGMILESLRILKPKGKLLLIDWSDSFGGMGPQPAEVIKPDVARTMFESEGFQFDRDVIAGDHHYGFIFKKQ